MTTSLAASPPVAPRVDDPAGASYQIISTGGLTSAMEPRRLGLFVATWAAVLVLGLVVVAYGIGPFLHVRDQRVMLETYRATLGRAANEAFGLDGVKPPTKAPLIGEPVAILEIPGVQLQEVIVEGVSPAQTQQGPGHVPGTAMPGQPYNSVVVGRSGMFGAPFSGLVAVRTGDPVLVTTTQGQRVYTVESVRRVELLPPGAEAGDAPGAAPAPVTPAAAAPPGSSAPPGSTPAVIRPEPVAPVGQERERVPVDELFSLGDDHTLTLVTSDSALPWNVSDALVVKAKMRQVPYVDWTPPNGRSDAQTGLTGDPSVLPALLLAVLGFMVAAVTAVALYRTRRGYVAYLLSTPPLLAFVVLGAEMLSRLLPAWS